MLFKEDCHRVRLRDQLSHPTTRNLSPVISLWGKSLMSYVNPESISVVATESTCTVEIFLCLSHGFIISLPWISPPTWLDAYWEKFSQCNKYQTVLPSDIRKKKVQFSEEYKLSLKQNMFLKRIVYFLFICKPEAQGERDRRREIFQYFTLR